MQRLEAKDKFTVVKDDIEYEFEVAEEGGYIVSVPELPGCVSEGDDFEGAWRMIQDAMAGWLLVARKQGDPIAPKFRKLAESIS
ncbi:MAG: type II toxin-antitoxin system HicB family antitoxin [Chloroflexi bacterium]|nr:type II toxin-antitoxin system HicB family antitoxin [Chloroflexota bacterium]